MEKDFDHVGIRFDGVYQQSDSPSWLIAFAAFLQTYFLVPGARDKDIPCLVNMVMEAPSRMLKQKLQGTMIRGFEVRRKGEQGKVVSQLLFDDNTMFGETNDKQL